MDADTLEETKKYLREIHSLNHPDSNDEENVQRAKRKQVRRPKNSSEKPFPCSQCKKSYFSLSALNYHFARKHEIFDPIHLRRKRGRPKLKFYDFEDSEYPRFYNQFHRKFNPNSFKPVINIKTVCENVFHDIFDKNYPCIKSSPRSLQENPILNALYNHLRISLNKFERTADEVIYEYLDFQKEQTNETFFTLMVKVMVLFRECYNNFKKKRSSKNENKSFASELLVNYFSGSSLSTDGMYNSEKKPPEGEQLASAQKGSAKSMPDCYDEFLHNFLMPNDYFGVEGNERKTDMIEIVRHFSVWVYRNDYTTRKYVPK